MGMINTTSRQQFREPNGWYSCSVGVREAVADRGPACDQLARQTCPNKSHQGTVTGLPPGFGSNVD